MKRFYPSIRSCLQKMQLAPAVFGMGWNLLLALINGGFSINYRSYWYLTLAVLYFLLELSEMPHTVFRSVWKLVWVSLRLFCSSCLA